MDFDPDRHMAAMAPLIGLTIDEAWRPGVAANLATAARMAELVLAFPLEDEVEPAGIYEAGRCG